MMNLTSFDRARRRQDRQLARLIKLLHGRGSKKKAR